uniref:Uncharacterized protein n=1 Tax=Anguilla anguilla TaxID=7936 RepID=A0A0E9W4D5_ANGAN
MEDDFQTRRTVLYSWVILDWFVFTTNILFQNFKKKSNV